MKSAVKDHVEYYDDGKEDQIWEWVTNTGSGLMNFEFGGLPNECLDFCIQQYARFNVAFPPVLHDVAVSGASASFYYADVIDPYVLFKGVSDVDLTHDWVSTTYRIHDADGSGVTREADPQFTETFRSVPGQAERMFNEMVMRPGLKALPWFIGEGIEEVLEGHGEEVWESVGSEVDATLRAICHDDRTAMLAYFELAAWAGFIWLASPWGREWRWERHEIMACAMEHGECILVDGTIIAPAYYEKIARPPNSCHRCGTQTWCVESTLVGRSTVFICEACMTAGAPKFGFANCGTKYCRDTGCPHHPLAHMGSAGIYTATSRAGQLSQMARHGADVRLYGGYSPVAQLRPK